MYKVKFLITYDGSDYYGFQRQPDQKTVQETIENTLSTLINQKISIVGAGRTDRGVHAKGQVICAIFDKEPNLESLHRSLNALLPSDIRILSAELVDDDFHPRYSSKEKIYRYKITTSKIQSPFERKTHYHHPYGLDLELLKKALPHLVGTHDYTSFANVVGKNSNVPSPIKTIFSIEIEERADGFDLIFHGDGFLYKMVRNITGALINVGEGRLSLSKLEEILKKKDNRHRLLQAPAHGLCLESVRYPLSLKEKEDTISV